MAARVPRVWVVRRTGTHATYACGDRADRTIWPDGIWWDARRWAVEFPHEKAARQFARTHRLTLRGAFADYYVQEVRPSA